MARRSVSEWHRRAEQEERQRDQRNQASDDGVIPGEYRSARVFVCRFWPGLQMRQADCERIYGYESRGRVLCGAEGG